MGQIIIEKGDITQYTTDAIVNAANNELLHGGGLAAAIVSAGGQEIQEQSSKIAPIDLGEAAVTDSGKLKCKYIIHAASMRLGELTSEVFLRQAIVNSFKRALELDIKSIAFPAIGTGVGKFPVEKCAEISLEITHDFLQNHQDFQKVVFVLHSDYDLQAFQQADKNISKK